MATAAKEERAVFLAPSGDVIMVLEKLTGEGPVYTDPQVLTTVEFALELKERNPEIKTEDAVRFYENLPEAPPAVMSLIPA